MSIEPLTSRAMSRDAEAMPTSDVHKTKSKTLLNASVISAVCLHRDVINITLGLGVCNKKLY